MAIFDKILGAFFEVEEEDKAKAEQTETKENTENTTPKPQTASATVISIPLNNGQLDATDQKIYTILKNEIANVGKEVLDKFYSTLKPLEAAIPDATLRYMTAMNIAAGYGITKPELIGIFAEKMRLLDIEKNSFLDERNNQEKVLQSNLKSAENMDFEIEQLQKKIMDLTQKKKEILDNTEKSKKESDLKLAKFEGVFALVKNEMNEEKSRLEQIK